MYGVGERRLPLTPNGVTCNISISQTKFMDLTVDSDPLNNLSHPNLDINKVGLTQF